MDLFDEKGNFENNFGEPNLDLILDNLSWDEIGPKVILGLEKRKKRRRFIWLFFIGISFFSMSIGALIFWHKSKPNAETIANVNTNTSDVKSYNDSEISEYRINVKDNSELNKLGVNTPVKKTNNSNELDFLDTTSFELRSLVSKLKNQENKKGIQNLNDLKSSNANKISKSAIQNNNDPARTKAYEQDLLNQNKRFESKNINYSFNDWDASSKLNSLSIQPITSLSLYPINFDSDYSHLKILSDTLSQLKIDFSKWSLSLSGGSNIFYSNSDGNDLTPLASEKVKLGWQSNIRLGRNITKHWSVQAGLEVKQLSFKSELISAEDVKLNRPNTLDTVFVSFQSRSISSTYKDEVPGLRIRNFQNYNKYTVIKLPVLLGYELSYRRVGLALQTGASFQLFRKNEGRTITHTGAAIDLNDEEIYASSVHWSYFLESQVSYRISKSSKFLALFSFDRQMKNWIVDGLNYQQRPTVFSASFGLSWDL